MQKNILITGVLGNIGSKLAKAFRQEGFYVYGLDKRDDIEQKSAANRFIRFDIHEFVRDAEYRIRYTALLDQVIPRLDGLVNNAAVQSFGSLKAIRLEDWQEALNVNMTGPLMMSKLFQQKLSNSQGFILNIGCPIPSSKPIEQISYTTSKGGLIALTGSLAADLAGQIRVNAISPEHADNTQKKYSATEQVAHLAVFLAAEKEGLFHGKHFNLGQ